MKDGLIEGTIGDEPLSAEFAREPPDPGAQKPAPPGSVSGEYKLVPRSACLGGKIEFTGSSKALELEGKGVTGEFVYADAGKITGTATCASGDEAEVTGAASNRDIVLTLVREQAPEGAPPTEKVVAQKIREFPKLLAAFFIAVAIVMLAARLMGQLAVKIGQPRVMGEVLAGILLGPTLFGVVLPEVQRAVFPPDVIPFIGVAANLGLIFYMFLVGLEIDISQLKGRISQTAAISNTGVAIPMIAGLAVALPVYELVGPDSGFTAFALFMGVSMSITAFPVLARILVERRMLKRPLGVIALTSAAIDDISAWFLIALATAVAVAGSGTEVVRTIAARRRVRRRDGARRPEAARARLDRLRRGRPRAGRVDRGHLRRRAAVGLRDRADRHRAHLRRVRDGRGHAAPRGPHRGRHAPRRGLRRPAAAAAVLLLHRPAHQRPAARPRRAARPDPDPDRGGDRVQVRRVGARRAASPASAGASRR